MRGPAWWPHVVSGGEAWRVCCVGSLQIELVQQQSVLRIRPGMARQDEMPAIGRRQMHIDHAGGWRTVSRMARGVRPGACGRAQVLHAARRAGNRRLLLRRRGALLRSRRFAADGRPLAPAAIGEARRLSRRVSKACSISVQRAYSSARASRGLRRSGSSATGSGPAREGEPGGAGHAAGPDG